jgi:ABC-type polysaccharide/polyol phosphate export permease
VWHRRRLVRYLVRADLRKQGADTLLGNLWWVLEPVLQMAVYVVLVAVILQRGAPDYPLFVFVAVLPWKWFATAVNDAAGAVVARDRLIKQVSFPKLVLPVAVTIRGLANLAFGLVALVAVALLVAPERLSPFLLLLPVVAAVQALFTLACAIAIAAVNVFYRDVGNLSRHALRLWFYLSPALYALEDVARIAPDQPLLARLMGLNPFAILLTAYRDLAYHARTPDWASVGLLGLISAGLLALAVVLFKRLEPAFAKVL